MRRTLPPWRFDENLAELVRVLPRYRVDEVIVKVDVEEFSHGQPPIELVQGYQNSLFRVKEAMDRLGIVYSINPWITHGHGDRGRDSRSTIPGAQMVVGHDGTRAKSCACSLSKPWRQHIAATWRLYAETGPRVIWVEDDIRTFNHAPVRFGCFCPQHLRRFSQHVGRRVSRTDLVAAILKPGKPHPWRTAWLDMLGEIMIDVARFLARTVHEVDPEISLGLMSSGYHHHCVEGRRWRPFAEALADGRPLYSRAPLGNYSEGSLRGLQYSHASIKGTRHVMPPDTIEQSEVENFTFGPWSNSATFTFLKMAVSFAYGSHGVTMNLFEHSGVPMEAEPQFGRMLADRKPFLEALAAVCQQPGRYRGVRLLHHERAAHVMRLQKGDDYDRLAPDHGPHVEALEALGIPTTCDDESVVSLCGQTVAAMSDDEIRSVLRHGVLIDAVSAGILVERGFGRDTGIRSIASPRPIYDLGPLGAEAFEHEEFGGAPNTYLTTTIGGGAEPRVSAIEPVRSARVISWFVDPDRKRHLPCMFAYENRHRGRVVVQAYDVGSISAQPYCRPLRVRQMQHAMQWLAGNDLPLVVHGDGAWPLAFRKDCDRHIVLGMFNLSLDDWGEVTFDLDGRASRGVDRIHVLDPHGRWRANAGLSTHRSRGRWLVRCDRAVSHQLPLVVLVRRKDA
ncbi:MAG: hypothetical protein CMJ18_20940 [Phycisphaeraceae bacterium]|nr:hypothetical protein [Phycisphaeraceae bacterium]